MGYPSSETSAWRTSLDPHERWAILLAACALLASCATEPIPKGTRFVVSAPMAEFYKNGPAQEPSFAPQMPASRTVAGQDFGPDGQLPKGASVTLLKREIGFSRVVTDAGAVGYVSNDQLQRAPVMTRAAAPPLWRENPTPNPRRGRAPQQTRPPEEKLDLSDLELPLPS